MSKDKAARISSLQPMIAELCWWYPRGDTNREPRAAIVTGSNPGGVLDVSVILKNGRRLEFAQGVRHRDDPSLEQFPQHAVDNGVWDFVGGKPPDVAASTSPPLSVSQGARVKANQ
ncbi:MAG TPA: hypothetical protein VMY42_06460 [Thermoguttaceae bacterium]|nr:hypothetical protein [Thermoguttaceae bacterium]